MGWNLQEDIRAQLIKNIRVSYINKVDFKTRTTPQTINVCKSSTDFMRFLTSIKKKHLPKNDITTVILYDVLYI